jgi:outer membrane receptor for ferrienterochelin and colicins
MGFVKPYLLLALLAIPFAGLAGPSSDSIPRAAAFLRTDSGTLMDAVVLTATRTARKKTQTPVLVNVTDRKTMSVLQACVLTDALKFQPGLRVETNCQTCNYTQLRMNGLSGAYSQILVNGRPVFGAMMSLYGMEQLPVDMVERIEVVRGGGSSLYGSGAVGGTVNVITRIPDRNLTELSSHHQLIGGSTGEHTLSGYRSWVSKDKKAGATAFVNRRVRGLYDHNADGFSELPELRNLSGGANLFFKPDARQKWELFAGTLNEYRYGGDMSAPKVQLARQAEQRRQRTWLSNLDYQLNSRDARTSLILHTAAQLTTREHYTGILPDEAAEVAAHIRNPPFGNARSSILASGFQLNHRLDGFLKGTNTLTFGGEYLSEKVVDRIPAYAYDIDQHTRNAALFLQSDWQVRPSLTLLTGIRLDRHNLLPGRTAANPRLALLYRPWTNVQVRLGYGQGFRAPQAFDTDLHVAFAGGGVSRVRIPPGLLAETSDSWSLSVNADHASENRIFGYTFELFHTRLTDPFALENAGNDGFGEVFEKRNGIGAVVQGATVELRANLRKKFQIEASLTGQRSLYEEPVYYIDGLPAERRFLRTPDLYGYSSITLTPSKDWSLNLNHVYTGPMRLAHFGSEENLGFDRLTDSRSFHEVNLRVSRTIRSDRLRTDFELMTGVRNLFNQYQDDFDRGKNRDSNYIYGPMQPRSVFAGLKVRLN